MKAKLSLNVMAAEPLEPRSQRRRFEEQFHEGAAATALVDEVRARSACPSPPIPPPRPPVVPPPRPVQLGIDGKPLPPPTSKPPRKRRRPKPPEDDSPPRTPDFLDLLERDYTVRNRAHIEECLTRIRTLPKSDRTGDALNNLIRSRMRPLDRKRIALGYPLFCEQHRQEPTLAATIDITIRHMLVMAETFLYIAVHAWLQTLVVRVTRALPSFDLLVEKEFAARKEAA